MRNSTALGVAAGAGLPIALRGAWANSQPTGTPVFFGFGGECPRFGVFDDHTFDTLVAFAEQIVPTDQDPGSTDLCAASLIEAIAAGDANQADLIIAGLAAIDQSSNLLYGQDFKHLSCSEQIQVMIEVEAGQAPGSAWSHPLFKQWLRDPSKPLSKKLKKLLKQLRKMVPNAYCMDGVCATSVATQAQQAVFGTLRTLSKLAFVLNFPENVVRNPDGTPIFSDPQHLISDPDDDATQTGWTIVKYHEIDWTVEQLMWEWQAGYRVIGFNGVPVLDVNNPLTEQERLAARDALYALSDQGLA